MQSGVCLTYLIFVPQNLRTSALLLLNLDISTTVWLLLMVIVQIPLSWIRDIRRLTVTNLLANVLILFGLTSCLGLAMRQMGERSVEASTSFLEEMVHRAKSLPAFNPDGWFLFLGTSVLLFEGSITLLVPLIEAVHTPEDKQKFPSMYRKVILGIVSFYAFFGIVCWMAIGDSVRTVMTTSLPHGVLATMIQLAYSLAVVFTFPLQNFPSLEIVCASVEKILPNNHRNQSGRSGDSRKSSRSKKLKGSYSYSEISNGRRNIISSMVVVSLSIVAISAMNDLDKVVSLMGGLLGCPLAFVLPPLIENELGEGRIGSQKRVVNLVVAAFGVGAMFISTLTTLINWD
jgi:proton-coupled amino acid transporter